MHSSCILAIVLALATVTCALDLSHAKPDSIEEEARFFNILNDLYAQVIYPPMNHIVQNLALLGAQALAGISQVGIPAPGRRAIDTPNAKIQELADNIWKTSIKPRLEEALSGFSSLTAQILARLSDKSLAIGKRNANEAEMRNFFDDLWHQAIKKPLENTLSDLSLMAAQILAGIGTNGVTIGKRDVNEVEMRNFFDDLWQQAIKKPLENTLSDLSLMAAQILAGIGTNGVTIGKRDLSSLADREDELRGIFDSFGQTVINGLQSVWSNIFQNPLEQAVQTSALLAAQVLAGLGTNGVSIG